MSHAKRVLIMGAGGRDFHVFNTCYREDADTVVVAFTAAQIPNIDDRRYPPALSGPQYPDGIPIVPEDDLEATIEKEKVEHVVFAYSDVSMDFLAEQEERVRKTGATFTTFDAERCLLKSSKPVLAICAVRTGCGKSPVARYVTHQLREAGLRIAVLRHPMPYGNLDKQIVQRFEKLEDLETHECTIEEMEEYEPHIEAGDLLFAGVDYGRILEEAEKEADVILWDGGNNDTPFVKPDLMITLLDPLRAGDETSWFPSRWNLRHADVLLVTKVDEATPEAIEALRGAAREHNPDAAFLLGRLPIGLADEAAVKGKKVLVVEDGPTVTHGGMGYGAGLLAAKRAEAAEIVDPRPYAVRQIADAFEHYPHLHDVLPALGYGAEEVADLQETIAAVPCDAVVIGTPIDLGRIVDIPQPAVRVTYDYAETEEPGLAGVVRERFLPTVQS
ncbi:MAG: GTPase [Planctomycetota bacterium]|nr:GTPase [Planctomycetota bacterium]